MVKAQIKVATAFCIKQTVWKILNNSKQNTEFYTK